MRASLLSRSTLIPLLLAACSPGTFYTNGPIDARPVNTSITARAVNAENRAFRVYKLNDALYALLPSLYSTTKKVKVGELNQALILSPEQRDSLISTANRISTAYDRRADSGATIIAFELVENSTEILARTSTTGTRAGVQTTGSAVEVNRIIFRLQYSDVGKTNYTSGQRIDYMLHGTTRTLSIRDLRALVRDLSK